MKQFIKYHTTDSPHLIDKKIKYIDHIKSNLSLTYSFIKGTLYGIVHSFLPNVFKKKQSDIAYEIDKKIKNLHDQT